MASPGWKDATMLKTQPQRTRGVPSIVNANFVIPVASGIEGKLSARLAGLMEAYCCWLTGQPMSQQDWTAWEVRRTEAFLRSATNGLVRHVNGLVSECPCCAI
jgi:hypothetical protein